ncbi:MAG: cupin domain-containing protein [Planctomycetes bacterium]|nr:cupin domain-containing protein [Planctomycetota bacterium]
MHTAIQMVTTERDWKPFADAPGVAYKTLRKHEGGGLTLLLKFEPGARYHTHSHPGGEEYYVLEGVLDDLGKPWPAGSYIWHPPGSTHRPASRQGATVLVVLPQSIERTPPAGE